MLSSKSDPLIRHQERRRHERLLSPADQGLIRVAEIDASHETRQLIDLIDKLLEKLYHLEKLERK